MVAMFGLMRIVVMLLSRKALIACEPDYCQLPCQNPYGRKAGSPE